MTNTVSVVKQPCADLKVVNAARVSMNKQHDAFDEKADTRLIRYLATHAHWTPFVHNRELIIFPMNSLTLQHHFSEMLAKLTPEESAGMVVEFIPVPGETSYYAVKHSLYGWTNLLTKLADNEIYAEPTVAERIMGVIKDKYPVSTQYLLPEYVVNKIANNPIYQDRNRQNINNLARYLTPAMFDITFYEKVPIFVARQRFKHMIQFDYNEVSRRYVDDTPYFYFPEDNGWRGRPDKSIKQGSGGVHENSIEISVEYKEYIDNAKKFYESLIERKVAPEMARMVLPQSMVTEYFATGNITAIQRLLKQRLDSHAQLEIQEFAQQMDNEVRPLLNQMGHIIQSGHDVMERLAELGIF